MYRQADRFSPCAYLLHARIHANIILIFISDMPVGSVLGTVK
jgi:hypothetical protein